MRRAFFRLVHLQGSNLAPDMIQPVVLLSIGIPHLLQAAEAVQISQVAGLIQELLAVVLAVNVDQLGPQGFQLENGTGHAPHPAEVFSIPWIFREMTSSPFSSGPTPFSWNQGRLGRF